MIAALLPEPFITPAPAPLVIDLLGPPITVADRPLTPPRRQLRAKDYHMNPRPEPRGIAALCSFFPIPPVRR